MQSLDALSLDALFSLLTQDGQFSRLLDIAYAEDLGQSGPHGAALGDITSRACIDEAAVGRAAVVARQDGVLSGIRCIPTIRNRFSPDVQINVLAADAQHVQRGTKLCELVGPLRQILALERTLLNLVGRLAGVATTTNAYVKLVEGLPVKLLDTRKTTPGLRNLEKYAVRCGGGHSHRLGLYDAVLIKDNHIAGVPTSDLAKVAGTAAARARAIAQSSGGLRFVEIEVDSLDQFSALISGGVLGPGAIDTVLLDNFELGQLKMAVDMRATSRTTVQLEASGGVNSKTIRAIAQTGVDRISVGALTHHAVSMDVALDIE